MSKWTAGFLILFVVLLLIVGGIILFDVLAMRSAERVDEAGYVSEVVDGYVEKDDADEEQAPNEVALMIEGDVAAFYVQGGWIYYAIVQDVTEDESFAILVGQLTASGERGQELYFPIEALEAEIVHFEMTADGDFRFLLRLQKEEGPQFVHVMFDEAGDVKTQTTLEFPFERGQVQDSSAVFAPNGEIVMRALVLEAALYTFAPDGTLRNKLEVGFDYYLARMRDGRVVVLFESMVSAHAIRELNLETGYLGDVVFEFEFGLFQMRSAPVWSEFDLYFNGLWFEPQRYSGIVLLGYDADSGQFTPLLSWFDVWGEFEFMNDMIAYMVFLEDGRIAIPRREWEGQHVIGTHLIIVTSE
ncbi:MAG: hypothetical protein FWE08_02690 [Oscillospiraceae bacterium]|nr:hypothetical protein [Oscillospiraceae bacterium]